MKSLWAWESSAGSAGKQEGLTGWELCHWERGCRLLLYTAGKLASSSMYPRWDGVGAQRRLEGRKLPRRHLSDSVVLDVFTWGKEPG